MTVKVYNQDGAEVGTMDLSSDVFGVEPNEGVVHQYVVNYLSNQRQGTSSTKGRKEVSGGGAKPWRQKGTGRARVGTIRSPLWRGGGIVHGPKPRNFSNGFPKQMKKLALLSVLSDKAKHDRIMIVDEIKYDAPKTKQFAELVKKLNLEGKKALFLEEGRNDVVALSARNIKSVKFSEAALVNAYDVLNAEQLILTKAGLSKVEEVFA
jgi:large subunit ribosomal protein L4